MLAVEGSLHRHRSKLRCGRERPCPWSERPFWSCSLGAYRQPRARRRMSSVERLSGLKNCTCNSARTLSPERAGGPSVSRQPRIAYRGPVSSRGLAPAESTSPAVLMRMRTVLRQIQPHVCQLPHEDGRGASVLSTCGIRWQPVKLLSPRFVRARNTRYEPHCYHRTYQRRLATMYRSRLSLSTLRRCTSQWTRRRLISCLQIRRYTGASCDKEGAERTRRSFTVAFCGC